ncbi:hypothetical protein V6N11_001156 [Hibiscus sabdariffa]|uniref:Uncharacterized protein n=1 Tax=Hibiscus sabdariffa TaxID=183260 RepID=A0ABR2RYY1_9ROSI
MKAMEEVVEFLGEFCGDKVAGVGKGTDLVGSLQKSFNPEMKLPSTSAFAGCFVSMKFSENAHKKALKKKETLAPEVMEKTITVIAVPVMISLIPCPVILLLNGSTRFSEQMTRYRAPILRKQHRQPVTASATLENYLT